jgi:hypothetical protein
MNYIGLHSCEAPILWVMDCPNYATYKILPYIYNYTTTNLQIEYNDIVEDYHNSTDPDPDVRKIYLLSGCNNKNKYTEGRLTTELLKLLNKNSTDNFVNIFNRLNNIFTEDTELSTYKKNLFIHELLLEFFQHPKAINLIKDEPIFKNRTKNEIEKNKISIVKSIIGSK